MLHLCLAGAGLLQNFRNLPELAPIDREMHRSDRVEMADRSLVECDKRKVVFPDGFLQALRKTVAHAPRLFAGILLLNLRNHIIACTGGKRRCRHRAAAECLVQFLALIVKTRTEICHAVSVSADCAGSRIAAGNDLAEYREVRVHIEESLCTVDSDAECGDDFIEDKQRAVFVCQSLRSLDELF